MSSEINVEIISNEGNIWKAEVSSTTTINTLKMLAAKYFYPENESPDLDGFRVIYPEETKSLTDGQRTLHDEKVMNDKILLFVKRTTSDKILAARREIVSDSQLPSPTLNDIIEATKSLPTHPVSHIHRFNEPGASTRKTDDELFDEDTAVDFQRQLRKIIMSLLSVMTILLEGNTESGLICEDYKTKLQHRINKFIASDNSGQSSLPETPQSTPEGISRFLVEVKKREFKPNPKNLQILMDMGFDEETVTTALRATRNNKDAAMEKLIHAGKGNKIVVPDELEKLNEHDHMYEALVKNPTIRLGLLNPKLLLAFLGILDNSTTANVWLNDTDTGPVLSAIFKIYHTEKHNTPANTAGTSSR